MIITDDRIHYRIYLEHITDIHAVLLFQGTNVSELMDQNWVTDLAFLASMSEHLDNLNRCLHGNNENVDQNRIKDLAFLANMSEFLDNLNRHLHGNNKNVNAFKLF